MLMLSMCAPTSTSMCDLLSVTSHTTPSCAQATIIIAVRLIFDLRPASSALALQAEEEYVVASASVQIAISTVTTGEAVDQPTEWLPAVCGVVMTLTHLAYLAALLVRRPFVDLRCFALAVAFSFAQVCVMCV